MLPPPPSKSNPKKIDNTGEPSSLSDVTENHRPSSHKKGPVNLRTSDELSSLASSAAADASDASITETLSVSGAPAPATGTAKKRETAVLDPSQVGG